MNKAQMLKYRLIGEAKLNQQISVVSKALSNDLKELLDLFQIQDNFDAVSEVFKNNPAKNTRGYDLTKLDTIIQTKFDQIQEAYTTAIGQDPKNENYVPSDTETEQVKKQKQSQMEEFKLVQSLVSNKKDIEALRKQIALDAAAIEAMPKTSQDDKDKKEAKIIQFNTDNQNLQKKQQSYLSQLSDVYRTTDLNQVFNKLILASVEGSLPSKFCWKAVAAEKKCKDPKFEYHFTKCKLKCNDGFERFGFHCRPSCGTEEIELDTCKYSWLKTRISRKTGSPLAYPSRSSFRYLQSPESTYNPPLDQSKLTPGHDLTCPNPDPTNPLFTLNTGWFVDTCKPKYNYECPAIGYQVCMAKGCAISTLDCNNYKVDVLLNLAQSVLKITTMFVAPGTGAVLGWIIQGVGYLASVKDIFKSIRDKRTQFLNVYNNPILKQNLINKMLDDLKGNDWLTTNIDRAIVEPAGDIDTKLKRQIKFQLDLQFATITKQNEVQAAVDAAQLALPADKKAKLPEGVAKLNAQNIREILTQTATLMASATNGITTGILAKETSAFFGDGITITSVLALNDQGIMEKQATSSLNLGQLFNFDTFLSLYTAGNSCIGNAASADCISSLVGVGANFDPTGISNLLKVFIQPFCDVGSALDGSGKPIAPPEEIEVQGTLYKVKEHWYSGTSADRVFVKIKNDDNIRYFVTNNQPQNLRGLINSANILKINIAENYKGVKGQTQIVFKLDKAVKRNNYELIAKPGVAGSADWVAWFKAKKIALESPRRP